MIRTSSGWTRRSSYCLSRSLYLSFVCRLSDNICRYTKLVLDGAHAKRYTKASLQRIVFTSIVIRIEELFKPLQELEVVLETTLYQFIHWNYLC